MKRANCVALNFNTLSLCLRGRYFNPKTRTYVRGTLKMGSESGRMKNAFFILTVSRVLILFL